MKTSKGFTLIELLVVIAIIGILSSIVLASLNTARDKGSDAAIKANMSGLRAQAELTYDDDDGDYANVCADVATALAATADITGATTDVSTTITDANTDENVVCHSTAAGWAASALTTTAGTYWCVDDSGVSEEGALAASAVACS